MCILNSPHIIIYIVFCSSLALDSMHLFITSAKDMIAQDQNHLFHDAVELLHNAF